MTWDEIATKEGRIYCQGEDTWCAFVNMNDGSCTRASCVLEEPNMYCKWKGVFCAYVDEETGECRI